MRLIFALALSVSFPVSALAADWTSAHSQGIAALNRNDYAAAAASFRESLSLAQTPGERGRSENDLGVMLYQINHDTEARAQLEAAFRTWQEIPGEEVRLAQTTGALVAVYRALGDYPAAEVKLREALKTPPRDDENLAIILNELGDVLREVGRPNEARRLLEKTLTLTGISERRRVDASVALADLDRDERQWQSSIDRWNYVAETSRKNHWDALEASAVRGLGVTYLEHNEPARAEPLLQRALKQFEGTSAPEHQIATTLSCLGQLYIAQNKYSMAEEVLIRARDLTEKSLSPTHPQVAIVLEMLGEAAAQSGQFDEAHDYYLRARAIMAGRFGDPSPIAAAVDASWAMTEQRSKHNAEAAADYEKALAVLDAAGPEVETLRSAIHARYAQVCKALHRKPSVLDSYKTQSFAKTPVSQSR
jgi:tetratricopeptide (TPR) repeat protein